MSPTLAGLHCRCACEGLFACLLATIITLAVHMCMRSDNSTTKYIQTYIYTDTACVQYVNLMWGSLRLKRYKSKQYKICDLCV